MKLSLLDMSPEQLDVAFADFGEKAFRAKQLLDWVYKKHVTDFASMSNLPQKTFAERFDILTSRVVETHTSGDGCTKLLIELHDGARVETVLIPDGARATACVSTQAGCAMGCVFCASGLDGLDRNLSSGEILEQLLHLSSAAGTFPTNVVFMGVGEPLANYGATVRAVRAIVDPHRFEVSARRVTVSTVGLPKQIRRLAKEDLAITLAISLHAPNDTLRRMLMPAAELATIAEIIHAAQMFYEQKKREVTLEYILLGGVNDTPLCARALAKIAKTLRCNVNLIRYNPVASLPHERPTQLAVQVFTKVLRKNGVNAHLRSSRGLDAEAACGQLRKSATKNDQTQR